MAKRVRGILVDDGQDLARQAYDMEHGFAEKKNPTRMGPCFLGKVLREGERGGGLQALLQQKSAHQRGCLKTRKDQARRLAKRLVEEAHERREAQRGANSFTTSPLPSSQQRYLLTVGTSFLSSSFPQQQVSAQPAYESKYGFLMYTDHLFVWLRVPCLRRKRSSST